MHQQKYRFQSPTSIELVSQLSVAVLSVAVRMGYDTDGGCDTAVAAAVIVNGEDLMFTLSMVTEAGNLGVSDVPSRSSITSDVVPVVVDIVAVVTSLLLPSLSTSINCVDEPPPETPDKASVVGFVAVTTSDATDATEPRSTGGCPGTNFMAAPTSNAAGDAEVVALDAAPDIGVVAEADIAVVVLPPDAAFSGGTGERALGRGAALLEAS